MSGIELQADGVGCAALGVAGGVPSAESIDYVDNKKQFQLHSMLTEQRHPRTARMSQTIAVDAAAGLRQILSVDEDIVAKLQSIVADGAQLAKVRSLQAAFLRALREKRKIYFYGCGATGRLAKLMESTFWRPFWARLAKDQGMADIWAQVAPHVSASVVDDCIGEMTGGDRALISSLEGFEDLQLIGRLQLQDRGVQKGDVVVAVTEGGETSSVIGTVLAALGQWRDGGAASDDAVTSSHLFFVYNNPDDLLMPFVRSASVLQEPGITKINLATGPQAITGSTRMQATSSETFVIAAALHAALDQFLRAGADSPVGLTPEQMHRVGFAQDKATSLESKLSEYAAVLESVTAASAELGQWAEWEANTYSHGRFATYFAQAGLMTVFIDNTERSPTFRLFALDTTDMAARRCWLQVWTAAATAEQAWRDFLGRPFRGLAKELYDEPFRTQIEDQYLRATALRSLPQAGDEQAQLYDFSFSDINVARRGGIRGGDLGVLVLVGHAEAALLEDVRSAPSRYVRQFVGADAPQGYTHAPTRLVIVFASESDRQTSQERMRVLLEKQGLDSSRICVVVVSNAVSDDALVIRAQTALKVALNALSTGVMARLGKVLGNSMVNVSPSNLKLIGRATALILNHVTPALQKAALPQVSYALVNAVLYDSIDFLRAEAAAKAGAAASSSSAAPAGSAATGSQQSAEVALCIVRILRSLEAGQAVPVADALGTLNSKGLGPFLEEFDARNAKKQ